MKESIVMACTYRELRDALNLMNDEELASYIIVENLDSNAEVLVESQIEVTSNRNRTFEDLDDCQPVLVIASA